MHPLCNCTIEEKKIQVQIIIIVLEWDGTNKNNDDTNKCKVKEKKPIEIECLFDFGRFLLLISTCFVSIKQYLVRETKVFHVSHDPEAIHHP